MDFLPLAHYLTHWAQDPIVLLGILDPIRHDVSATVKLLGYDSEKKNKKEEYKCFFFSSSRFSIQD